RAARPRRSARGQVNAMARSRSRSSRKTTCSACRGVGKIRWVVKTSGFHVVRPVVKLADGTMLVGDHADQAVPVLTVREFALSDVRWIRLDPMRAVTVNGGRGAGPANPNNEIWVNNPD